MEAARKAAGENGGILSRSDFQRMTGIGQYHIYRLFPEGGWSEVLELAGIAAHPQFNSSISDEDLLKEFHRVASEVGDVPTWPVFEARAAMTRSTFGKRFGGIRGTLGRYVEWLRANDARSPLLPLAEARVLQERRAPSEPLAAHVSEHGHWPKADGPEYGAPINFRGMRHAPINEQGVVYIFGMVSHELGFLVEAVHPAFPDCEAKRKVSRDGQRWQRVRIEFEYRSSNFLQHGHDPAGCDLIVCWEHDWPGCPLEVLELQDVLRRLEP